MSSLLIFLLHVSFVVNPRRTLAGRMLAFIGLAWSAAGHEVSIQSGERDRVVPLSPEFHGDLELWYWLR